MVNQWDARPELVVSKSVVYGSVVLDFTQLTICRIFVDSLKQTVKTHLMPFLEMKVPTLIRGTNHWGESVFHYVKMYLRLTWKCEVGAHLGLKRLIWG